MKLVMTILVKNEADIIETNIRFHAAQGVDAFLVMDNASTDETPDILKQLSREFDITVVHNADRYDQAKWMTALAHQAGKQLGADLVISNDADEFWAAKAGGSLKQQLSTATSILTVPRYNFVLSKEAMAADEPFWKTAYKVVSPILYSRQDQLNRSNLAMPLVRISPKIIVNPKGLIKIKGGNHRAKHWRRWATAETDAIEVHHYPVRSYQQFERNIDNRRRLLAADPDTRMGVHYKRWVEMLNNDQLEQEFFDMNLAEHDVAVLEKVGVIERVARTPLGEWAEQSAERS